MKLITFFFLFKVAGAHIILYQPQNTMSVNNGDTAVIGCAANDNLESGARIIWYRESWTPGNRYLLVIACLYEKDHYYECEHNRYETKLKILKAMLNDSGVYYCAYRLGSYHNIANGTFLTVKDISISKNPVHLLAHSYYPFSNTAVQLVCVVSETSHAILVTWNISGTYHKGRMVSTRAVGGVRTFQNLLYLSKGSRDYGNHVTCEVWFSSAPVQVHWKIPEKDKTEEFISVCQYPLGLALSVCLLLLLVLEVHLIWAHKKKDKNTQNAKRQDKETSDGIVYAHLDISQLARS